MDGSNFLSREQIDSIMEGMTARDIFAAMPSQTDVGKLKGAEVAGQAFEQAAERQGHGAGTLDRVRPQDATYLAQLLSDALSAGSPKADDTDALPVSLDSGGYPPS